MNLNNINNNKFVVAYVITTFFIVLGMMIFGYAYPQNPYSDFLIHWNQSVDHSMYIKGGALVYIYSFFVVFNFDAPSSALIVNILSWLVFSYSCFPGDGVKNQNRILRSSINFLFILILLTYGYWWIAVASTVEVMTAHIALMCAGLRICILAKNKFILLIGAVLVGFALSMRMQMILIALFTFIFYIFFYFYFNKNLSNFLLNHKRQILVLFLSIGVGSFIEFHLRSQSENQIEIAVMQRSQIYIGFIDSDTKLPSCGAWKQEAFDNARNDLKKSFFEIGIDYINEKPLIDIGSIYICKISRSIFSKIYVWWIPESRIVSNGVAFDSIRPYFIKAEVILNLIGRISMILIIFLLLKNRHIFGLHYIITLLSILFGFLFLYGLLEFNPRYQYQMIAILLFVIAMSLSSDSSEKSALSRLYLK